MKTTIYPNKVEGNVYIPSSKSLTHRYIMAASLAKGKSIINNVSYSDDVLTTINIFENLGVNIIKNENSLIINGKGKDFILNKNEFNMNESASTLRFMIPLLSSLKTEIIIYGKGRLLDRPLDVYEKIFSEQKKLFIKTSNKIVMRGNIEADKFIIDGNISSQFITGLLFYLPLLDNNSVIKSKTEIESIDYIYMTINVLSKFGISIDFNGSNCFYIKGKQHYVANDYSVEGDFSQAAFFATLGAINNGITINNLYKNSLQGDKIFFDYLEDCGIELDRFEDKICVHKSTKIKEEIIIDIKNYPDLGPILAVFGAICTKKMILCNVERLKIKESNRLEAIIKLLKSFKIKVEYENNRLYIYNITRENIYATKVIDSYSDHRIFMSAAILATIANNEVIINNSECINKSYPNFLNDLERLGIKLKNDNE